MTDRKNLPDIPCDGLDDDDDEPDCWIDASDDLSNWQQEYGEGTTKNTSCSIPNSRSAQESFASASSGSQANDLTDQQSFKTNSNCDSLQLHKAIFTNDLQAIHNILQDKSLAERLAIKKDKHGNTPLHLACMLGRPKEVLQPLLDLGSSVDCKNLNRWTPFHEACSYGDRETITLLTIQLKKSVYETINRTKLSERLSETRNYRLILKWEFRSWVPFLSRVLPNDVCVITKHGANIRIDTRLHEIGTEMFPWKRTEGCLIYSDKLEKEWVLLNNKAKTYHYLEPKKNLGKHVDHKVDDFMSTDIIDIELKSSDILLTRSTCGLIWKADKVEKIGKYNAALYNFNNVFLVTRKRREHLSEDDLKKNKMVYKSAMNVLKFGQRSNLDDNEEIEGDVAAESIASDEEEAESHRDSLPPPRPCDLTWQEYCDAAPGEHPVLGREIKCKTVKTAFKASIAMSEEFPITLSEFIDLISIIPLKLFKKLKEFIEMKLPDGFPIRLDVPILSFLTARITFEDFNFIDGPIDESLFSIPDDYVENPEMLSMFSKRYQESNLTDS